MIRIYNEKEIEVMRRGGRILAKIMEELRKEVRPGITTEYLDKVASDLIFSYGVEPSFKGFNNYPNALCTSINEEIVHAVPSKRKLKQGDILSLDLGIRYRPTERSVGLCVDMAITMPVGKIDKKTKKLVDVTKKSLELAIKQCKPGNHLEDIGWAIQDYVGKHGFNVIRELCGHGVGREVHEDPQILNYGETPSSDGARRQGVELKEGMVLALEPMVVMGDWRVEKCKDGFGYRTKDQSLTAHFEHTVAITKKGAKILTI